LPLTLRTEFDQIGLVEQAYVVDGTEREWMERVLGAAKGAIDQGLYSVGLSYRKGERPTDIQIAAIAGDAEHERSVREAHATVPEEALERTFGSDAVIATATELVSGASPAVRETVMGWHEALGAKDMLAVHARDTRGGFVLLTGLARNLSVTRSDVHRWSCIAAHLRAGLRLRRALEHGAALEQAVLTASGDVLHAEGDAKSASSRQRLRDMARGVDRARGRLRASDPDEALAIWRGLCAGTWSLVDRFDSDGRRYLIARRNEPHVGDPRTLTRREAQIVRYSAMGLPNKEIAYTLGLSKSSVSTHLARATRKLGVRGRAELLHTLSFLERSSEDTLEPVDAVRQEEAV
jgi:DNA-binding CsgD family transcriptional regulator